MDQSENSQISVIIINWNVADMLKKCLLSLEKLLTSYKYEIIVVDNASSDGSAEMVAKEFPHVSLINNSKNLGFAVANNQAATIAKGEYLLFVNPDTELQSEIEPMFEHFENERIGSVFGKLVGENGETQIHTLKRFPTVLNEATEALGLARIFPNVPIFNQEERDLSAYERPHYVDWGAGAFFVVKKRVFEKVGMFDEDYFVYGEDKDLLFRMMRLGYKAMFEPKVKVYHHRGSSTKQNPEMYLMKFRNKVLFMMKNYPPSHAFLHRYVFLTCYQLVRGIYSAILGFFVSSKSKKEMFLHKMKNQFGVVRWALFRRR